MAYYNSYYANGYNNPFYNMAGQPNYTVPNYTLPQQQQQVQMQNINNNGIVLIASEGDAQSYPVAPGNSQWMKDQYKNYLYIKTVDQSGMIMPLRKFKLIEETTNQPQDTTVISKVEDKNKQEFNPDLYVTWDALEKRLAEKLSKPSITKVSSVRKVNSNESDTNV